MLAMVMLFAACAQVPPEDIVITPEEDLHEAAMEVAVAPVPPDMASSRFGEMSCDLLKLEENRVSCKARMNDMIGLLLDSEIMDTFDIARCSIFPEATANSCKQRIEATGVKGPISAEEREIFNQAMSPVMVEVSEGSSAMPGFTFDIKKCAGLTTAGFKAHCENLVNERIDQQKLREIVSAGDVRRCAELVSTSSQERCRMMLGEFPVPVVTLPAVIDETGVPRAPNAGEPTVEEVIVDEVMVDESVGGETVGPIVIDTGEGFMNVTTLPLVLDPSELLNQ